jgi:predicted O-linked N-acetylglucosamine transferase (SPINDLY family)
MPFRFGDLLRAARPKARPDSTAVDAEFAKGIALHQQGRLAEAKDVYEAILAVAPDHADTLNLLGVLASQSGDDERALDLLARAIAIAPGNATFHYNRGVVLQQAGRLVDAIADYDRALAMQPAYAEAHANRGLALHGLREFSAAAQACDRAISLKPDYAEAHYNRGNALHALGDPASAAESHGRAVAIKPDFARAHCNRGFALAEMKRLEEALASFAAAARLGRESDFALCMWLFTKLQLCAWDDLDSGLEELTARIERGEAAALPFATLALMDSPALQKRNAEAFVRSAHPPSGRLGKTEPRKPGSRIRVGYFSGDFRDHAVSHLTAGLFEAHDRSRFEVFGFSFGPEGSDAMRERVAAAMDTFIDVRDHSDLEIAGLSRELGIDIAVDLGGHTRHSRTGIFALRAAPLQASYIGYLGTMGASYFDYLLADETIIPADSRRHYCEKVAYLPTYQSNDASRVATSTAPSRGELGLPAAGFVFCCFNNVYKISPAMFSRWMRILGRVDGSVLMLYVRNATAMANLRKEAVRRGIDADRLVFVDAVPHPEYLARFGAADLFLDTSPYNAGTVAADSLWCGLPVLTLRGESFAGRMGASLLAALDLPELIAGSGDDYEARAVEFARNPGLLAAIERKLDTNRQSSRLFDVCAFARSIEAAYARMHARRLAGEPPDHLMIGPEAR